MGLLSATGMTIMRIKGRVASGSLVATGTQDSFAGIIVADATEIVSADFDPSTAAGRRKHWAWKEYWTELSGRNLDGYVFEASRVLDVRAKRTIVDVDDSLWFSFASTGAAASVPFRLYADVLVALP